MAECDYEYECMRAELLGHSKPDRDTFLLNYHQTKNVVTELDGAIIEDIELQGEEINRMSGGVDSLNNILKITQTKLNKFKTVCGSLTNLLKLRLSGDGDSASSSGRTSQADDHEEKIDGREQRDNSPCKGSTTSHKTMDLEKEVKLQVDKLDSLLDKTESAQFRLASQNKQIKSYLKK